MHGRLSLRSSDVKTAWLSSSPSGSIRALERTLAHQVTDPNIAYMCGPWPIFTIPSWPIPNFTDQHETPDNTPCLGPCACSLLGYHIHNMELRFRYGSRSKQIFFPTQTACRGAGNIVFVEFTSHFDIRGSRGKSDSQSLQQDVISLAQASMILPTVDLMLGISSIRFRAMYKTETSLAPVESLIEHIWNQDLVTIAYSRRYPEFACATESLPPSHTASLGYDPWAICNQGQLTSF